MKFFLLQYSFVRFAFGGLMAAVVGTGCGPEQSKWGGMGNAGAPGTGGTTIGTGGTTSGTGGTGSGTGGTTSGTGGTGSGTGGTEGGTGGTTSGTGGAGGGTGGTGNGTGGTISGTGGRATGTGGTGTGTGGTIANTGGTTAAGTWGTPVPGGPTGTGTNATVTVNLGTNLGTVGPEFLGFSVEKMQISNASLTPANTGLVALYKLLGTPNLRIGANDVDRCLWVGPGAAPTQPHGAPFTFNVNTGHVDQFCGFLAATGSRSIYAVNFKLNNPAVALADATYVMTKCPQSIYTLEIGNETNLYPNDGAWTGQRVRWENFGTMLSGIPGATISGPAASNISAIPGFVAPFAMAEAPKFGSKLILLTNHFYVGGAGATATVANLLSLSTDFISGLAAMKNLATTHNFSGGWRLDEVNSFYNHGQPGVSDTLVQGLWSLDVMFQIATHGGVGINWHGGETGMDGTRPFYYQPLRMTSGVVDQVQPLYYGMLLFAQAGQGTSVSTTVATTSQNFTAYAIKGNGFTSVVLVNKSAANSVSATVNLGAAVGSASAIYLQGTPAASLTAPAGAVTLAGASVSTMGVWNRNPPYIQVTAGNTVSVHVPAASAVLVRVFP